MQKCSAKPVSAIWGALVPIQLFMDKRDSAVPSRCRHGHLKTKMTSAFSSHVRI